LLLSQTLIVHVIRRARAPFLRSRPIRALLADYRAVARKDLFHPFFHLD
jgi:hypothetical protein